MTQINFLNFISDVLLMLPICFLLNSILEPKHKNYKRPEIGDLK